MEDQQLEKLVSAARKGNRSAFRQIFDRLNDPLFAYAHGHTGDRDLAFDIVQDTFIDLWRSLPTFRWRNERAFYGFAFTVLRRKVAKALEARPKGQVSIDQEIETGTVDVLLAEHATDPIYEDYRYLSRAVARLGETAREMLALRYWSGLSYSEIAMTLDITETAAKVRHHRAIEQLRAQLSALGQPERGTALDY
ncbi:MAG TPA: sigma-70 family RNA polymerase sigma factor [Candidatus Paceibacterota bacterium]|nr:sigma-70 family RNA polymerase sigma factor [Candidatus Paceibacterota bacterium]